MKRMHQGRRWRKERHRRWRRISLAIAHRVAEEICQSLCTWLSGYVESDPGHRAAIRERAAGRMLANRPKS
jgi:hypothetical protein